MRLFGALAVILLFFFSCSAFAAIEGFPSQLTFYEEAQQISFRITNPADSAKRVSVEFLAPVEVEISAPLNIAAGKDANVSLVISPRKELTGQSYESTLIVKIGSEETRKSATVVFKSAQEKPAIPGGNNQAIGIDANAFGNAVTGVVSFVSGFRNETALDALLVIAVIILLIALIARVKKRLAR